MVQYFLTSFIYIANFGAHYMDAAVCQAENARAAFKLPWSNGQTEGHVNRLKFLKRQMYGRANIEVLRLRLRVLKPN